jgi:putative sugar O-methyltransferase
MNNVLKNRFDDFKKSIKDNEYGLQWNLDKKNFLIDFNKGTFENLGDWDFFPVVYDSSLDLNDLENIEIETSEKLINIGCKSFCVPKNNKNRILSHCINYFNLINKYINDGDTVCEVGSGSAVLSALIHQKKKTKNILIDIPEVMLVAVSMLFTIFPDKKYLLPNEAEKIDKININNYDFIFLTPSQINLIHKNNVNFCINTQSFMEMDKLEVQNYLKFFDKILKISGYFFCSNRLRKRHYFFDYPFNLINNLKIIFLEKDKYFYKFKKSSSMINLLAKKVENSQNIQFSNYEKFKGVFLFKGWEFLFWLKKDLKSLIRTILKFLNLRSDDKNNEWKGY